MVEWLMDLEKKAIDRLKATSDMSLRFEGCTVPAPSESMKDVIMELHDMSMKARSMSEEIRDKLFGMEPVKECETARDGNCAFDALCETRRITKYLLENLYSVIQRIEG